MKSNSSFSQFPGTVTIDLNLPVEFLAKTKAPNCAKVTNTKDNPQGQSDEADMSRTSRRHALYENAARPVVNFYSKVERLIKVDATSGNKEAVWEAVRKMTASLEFPVKKHDDPIILFDFGESRARGRTSAYSEHVNNDRRTDKELGGQTKRQTYGTYGTRRSPNEQNSDGVLMRQSVAIHTRKCEK